MTCWTPCSIWTNRRAWRRCASSRTRSGWNSAITGSCGHGPGNCRRRVDWTTWLVLAGRGFGKTRAGAEWVRTTCQSQPEARFALVGASLGEVRAVMVEGESGILAACPPGQVPQFEPSLRRLTWGNGAQATLYSAAEPESLRGPQHSHACRAGTERRLCKRNRGAP